MDTSAYRAPAEQIRTARAGIAEVMRLLAMPAQENAERCGELLGEVGVNLQSAAGMLREAGSTADSEFRFSIEQLRREVRTLAFALSESDRMVSGWLGALGARTGGYTSEGASAPLLLMRKVNFTG